MARVSICCTLFLSDITLNNVARMRQIYDNASRLAAHFVFQPEPGNGTMRSNNMFGYAGAPMPLPRLRPPGPGTISHAFRTPESSTSEEEDRTDLLGRSFQTSRPKSRSSLAVSMTTFDIPENAARFGRVFISNIIYWLKGLNI